MASNDVQMLAWTAGRSSKPSNFLNMDKLVSKRNGKSYRLDG